VTGNAGIDYATGGTALPFYSGSFAGVGYDFTSWTSSQTSTGYSLHRLGVREIMYNTQLPHRIRQGALYLNSVDMLWPYHLLRNT